jgi:hypothetical protein
MFKTVGEISYSKAIFVENKSEIVTIRRKSAVSLNKNIIVYEVICIFETADFYEL